MTAQASPRVDLHLHTTASDGRCRPAELVERALEAKLDIIAVTDHDTTQASAEVRELARVRGIDAVQGIEITAIDGGREVHILGYFFDAANSELSAFLATQQQARITRVQALADRLAELGMPIDVGALIEQATRDPGRSIGRPQVARAMIEAGHVVDSGEAFDRWLTRGAPAFVPRSGPSSADVIRVIHAAGGIASIAHPGADNLGSGMNSFIASGLDAVEAYHPDHDVHTAHWYVAAARDRRLLVTGGSDFHGDPAHGMNPGSVLLPPAEWERLDAARKNAR